MIGGHVTSKPTEKYPLPSSIFYSYNKDSKRAFWATYDNHINEGHLEHLKGAEERDVNLPMKTSLLMQNTDIGPLVDVIREFNDSMKNELIMRSTDEVFLSRLWIPKTSALSKLNINGVDVNFQNNRGGGKLIDILGMTQDSLRIQYIKSDISQTINFKLCSQIRGLPMEDVIPKSIVREDAYTAIVQDLKI